MLLLSCLMTGWFLVNVLNAIILQNKFHNFYNNVKENIDKSSNVTILQNDFWIYSKRKNSETF